MFGRRRDYRFETTEPWSGSLTVLRAVGVQPVPGGALAVISRAAAVAGQAMRIDLSAAGHAVTLRVRVVTSRPVADTGAVQHELRLHVLDVVGAPAAGRRKQATTNAAPLDSLLAAPDLVGVLTREIAARTRNISASGCLLETDSPVDAGTVAQLRIGIRGREYNDHVRVIRCDRVPGAGSTYRLAGEFAWATHPGVDSLRRIVKTLSAVGAEDAPNAHSAWR